MFKEILYNIKEDIYNLKGDSNALIKTNIKDRLDYSLEMYNENLENTCRYVLSRNPLTMLKSFGQEFRKEQEEEQEQNYEDIDYDY